MNEYESGCEDELPHYLRNDRQIKKLKYTFKSIYDFLLSLMMLFVGPQYNLLIMSRYKYMKPFHMNLNKIIKNIFVAYIIHFLVLTIMIII